MKYTVTILRTTGKRVEEFTYEQLEEARKHYCQIINKIPYQRVLILLLEKPDDSQENILEVDFVDGLQV